MNKAFLGLCILHFLLQTTLENSNLVISDIQTCVMFEASQKTILDNKLYLPQIRRIIPQRGQHLLSNLSSFYRGNTTDLVKQLDLFQNQGIAEFCKSCVIGMMVLVIFTLLIPVFKMNLLIQVSSEKVKKWLNLLILTGLLISGMIISYIYAKGVLSNSEIQEGLRQLDCSLDLFKQFHVTPDRNYSLFQFHQFLHRLTITSFKTRLKNNRIIWYTNHFLVNTKILNELIIKAQNSKEVQNDQQARQFLQKLRQFYVLYNQVSQAIHTDPSSQQYDGWLLHKNSLLVYKQTRPHKLSLLNIKQIIQEPLELLSQLLSPENIQSALLWLKIIELLSFAVVIIAIILHFIGQRYTSFTHNSLVYLTIMSCFMAFLVTLVLSVVLPYVAWGCEGANHLLSNQQNWNNQIARSNFGDSTQANLQLLGPYSRKKSLDIVQKQRKEYFPKLKYKIQKFLSVQTLAYEYTSRLQGIYQKYLNTEQDKQKLHKFVISMRSQAFRSLEMLLRSVTQLISILPFYDNINTVNGQKVGRALRSSVNSMCTTNFNNLYQTRSRINVLAYALLVFVVLLWNINYKKRLLKIEYTQQEESGTGASSHRSIQASYDEENSF